MARTLAAVADAAEGRLIGGDAAFNAVSTDTRSLERGSLFVAISGEHHDGNAFVADAEARGAAGAVVSTLGDARLPQVHVRDTRRALGAMARAWRGNFSVPAIAITGSSGKTTVKELTAAILQVDRNVCVTQGNLNNDIGVPLTMMRLAEEHEALVVELGANHAGEIDYLADIAQPTVGVITNAGAAHLEGFGSVAGVAAAKGELLDHLPHAGTAVLNADDPFIEDWRARSRADLVWTFGLRSDADFTLASDPVLDGSGSRFAMTVAGGERVEVELPLLGRQNIVNALAAAAAAHAVGVSAAQIARGLGQAAAVYGRMKSLRGRAGSVVVDDSYNANPSSTRAALDYLAALSGRRIFVLGDMFELGPDAEKLHREIGEYAKQRCDVLVAIGPLSQQAAAAYGTSARAYDSIPPAAAELEAMLGEDVTVLVKASRAMRLDRLVHALVETAGTTSGTGGAAC